MESSTESCESCCKVGRTTCGPSRCTLERARPIDVRGFLGAEVHINGSVAASVLLSATLKLASSVSATLSSASKREAAVRSCRSPSAMMGAAVLIFVALECDGGTSKQ